MLKKIFGTKDKPLLKGSAGSAVLEVAEVADAPEALALQPNESAPSMLPASTPPSPSAPKLTGATPTDQAMELLSTVDPDDVLELMIPRLIQERHRRLAQLDEELNRLDKQLAELYHRRDDALLITSSNQTNKDFTRVNSTSNSNSQSKAEVKAEAEPAVIQSASQRESSEAPL